MREFDEGKVGGMEMKRGFEMGGGKKDVEGMGKLVEGIRRGESGG